MSQKDTFLLLVGIGISFAIALLFDYQYQKKLAYAMQKNRAVTPLAPVQVVTREREFTINELDKEKITQNY